jgi:hypothetical protein
MTVLLMRAMLRCGRGPDERLKTLQRMSEDQRLTDVIAAIDDANACDPNRIEVDGPLEPAELVYGRRMSETLARMAPNASEHLRIAARGQHIERWTSPRTSYPAGRASSPTFWPRLGTRCRRAVVKRPGSSRFPRRSSRCLNRAWGGCGAAAERKSVLASSSQARTRTIR